MKYNKKAVKAFLNNDIATLKKLEEEKNEIVILLGNIQNGLFNDDSCVLAGIAENTFYQWMKKKEFSQAVGIAQARAKKFYIAKIKDNIDWKSAAWHLSKLDKRYREEQEIDIPGRIVIVLDNKNGSDKTQSSQGLDQTSS